MNFLHTPVCFSAKLKFCVLPLLAIRPNADAANIFFDLILYTRKNFCTGYFSIFRKHRLVPVYQAVPAAAGNRSGLLVIF